MDRSTEQRFSEAYLANVDLIGEGMPASVNNSRRELLEEFNLESLPDATDERYRHTDVREMFGGEWEQYFTPSPGEIAERLPVAGYAVDVVNGFHSGEGERLTTLASGIVYGSLRAALQEADGQALKVYGTVAPAREEVVKLNGIFMQDGAYVYVPEGVKADRPFVLTFEYDTRERGQACFPRALIVLGERAEADIIVSHHNRAGARFLVDMVRETVVGEGARLSLSEVVRMGEESALITGNYMSQGAGSRADLMSVWLRAGAIRVNAATDLTGPGCESNLHGLWFGTDTERTDINVRINHMAPECNSLEVVKGIVSGRAVGAFTGTVYVAQKAQRTVALQQSRNLLMTGSARVYTEPRLEIYADDVKCSHGATVGQMDTEAVFYMRQRGLSEQDARRLQMHGFVNDIVSRCPHEGACDFVSALADERIAEL